jgi:predicted Zn-dependent protease
MRLRRVATLILASVSLTVQEPFGRSQDASTYSLDKEAALGSRLAADVHQRTIPMDSPTVQSYIDSLGHKIAWYIPDAKFPFTFSVIGDDPCGAIHEPAALPGGYVFVPAALLLAAQDEAEFAGMLTHAMEHVTQRHWAPQETRGTFATAPLISAAGWVGGCSGGPPIPVAFLASQRNAELQADLLAVQIMARAGFDPEALVRYVERVQDRPSGTMSRTYSPMPDRDERVAALLATMETLPKAAYAAAPLGGFVRARQEVRRLVEHPVRSNAPPSLMSRRPQ